MTAFQLAPKWQKAANGRFSKFGPFPPHLTPQTARLEHYDVHFKSFSMISHLRNFCSFGLVVDHFGASWKAVIARSLTFEQRQIEGWSWWQNWPISCAFQLCCWVGDLKTNSLGSRPASMKMQEICPNGPFYPIFLKFEGVGGGLKRKIFRKFSLHPIISCITTADSTCSFVSLDYVPPLLTLARFPDSVASIL